MINRSDISLGVVVGVGVIHFSIATEMSRSSNRFLWNGVSPALFTFVDRSLSPLVTFLHLLHLCIFYAILNNYRKFAGRH
jgi:hypothetical protein